MATLTREQCIAEFLNGLAQACADRPTMGSHHDNKHHAEPVGAAQRTA